MPKVPKFEMINREVSWLSFNERVLQEASDPNVPLIERMRFLGIFSNNLDEFFRVRVATVKRMVGLGKNAKGVLGEDPEVLLDQIKEMVLAQRDQFGSIYDEILKEFREQGVSLLSEKQLNKEQGALVKAYFQNEVRRSLVPIMLSNIKHFPTLKDRAIYLAIKLYNKDNPKDPKYALIEVPSPLLPRFFELPPKKEGQKNLIILDDVIRYCLHEVFAFFNYDKIEAYTIKLTRDAELDIDEDISKSIIDKLSKSLKNRKVGQPVRFIYDKRMPKDLYKYLIHRIRLKEDENIIPGGRYHNFKDFIKFPYIGEEELRYPDLPPTRSPELDHPSRYLDRIKEGDIMLNYPYQTFDHIIDILREAAIDPKVTSIKINLYRVAKRSKVINALVNAVKNGKAVTAVVELRARFDEEANIQWANKLQEEGVEVIFGVEGLKVHSKLILITRKERRKEELFAHIGTGNFHEGTARLYADTSLLTVDKRITREVWKVFDFFKNNYKVHRYSHLLVSPINTRRKFGQLIQSEIRNARAGKPAYMILKMNNLVDEELIRKLYAASQAGVKIRLIVRGICSLVPGVKGMSENIQAISILDRFLEHSRIFLFGNGGKEKIYIGSGDWMVRNLDKRVEVITPVYDKKVRKVLRDMLSIQLQDDIKARVLEEGGTNPYRKEDGNKVRSQHALYEYFQEVARGKEPEVTSLELDELLKSS